MKEKARCIVRYLFMMAIVLGMFAGVRTTALAENESDKVEIGGVSISPTEDAEGDNWSYDAATKTITLDGFNYSGTKEGVLFITYTDDATFNIILKGENRINVTGKNGIGVANLNDEKANLNISGPGGLFIGTDCMGIFCANNMTIDGCGIVVDTTDNGDYDAAIFANHSMTISDAYVDVMANATSGEVHGLCAAMDGDNSETAGVLSITNSTVIARSYSTDGIGIFSYYGDIKIGKNAVVIASGGYRGIETNNSYHEIFLSADIKSVMANGNTNAIRGFGYTFKNAVEGTGWTDVKGTEGMATIPIDLEGQDLDQFKSVVFPKVVPTITKKPAAKELTYNESEQELITAGTAENGKLEYAIGTDTTPPSEDAFEEDIPTGKEVGTYYVWYRAVGAGLYGITTPEYVVAKIKEVENKPENEDEPSNDDPNKKENESNPDKPAEEAKSTEVSESVQTPAVTENIDNNQKNTTLSKPKAGNKSITLTWKKVKAKDIKGYEIQYSTDKAFSKETTKKVTIKKVKTTKTKIKKLKPKTRYYVRIRTFSKKNGENVYSKWSKAKNVKVK